MYDVAIIGGGPVGIFSAYMIGMEGLTSVIIEGSDELGGQCKKFYASKYIYDLPGIPKIKAEELIKNLIEQTKRFQVNLLLKQFVVTINKEEEHFKIKTHKEEIVEARTILLSLGNGILSPIKLKDQISKSLEGDKILYNLNNKEIFYKKDIAILGGGDTAIDYINELSNIANKIYLIHRRNNFKCSELSLDNIRNIKNLKFKVPYLIKELIYEKNNLSIKIENEEETEILGIDYILPCYGMEHNLSFLKEWDLDIKKDKIIVKISSMQTSKEGIYAIGDCIAYKDRRNLLITGFNEAAIVSRAIFKYLYPNKPVKYIYSSEISF